MGSLVEAGTARSAPLLLPVAMRRVLCRPSPAYAGGLGPRPSRDICDLLATQPPCAAARAFRLGAGGRGRNGPDSGRLEKSARDLGIMTRVRFAGRMSRHEVLRMLGDAHVLVHPSLHDSGGWVCVEAMAAGKPVICLDLGGPAPAVGGGAGGINPPPPPR